MDTAIRQLRSTAQQLTRGKSPSGVRYPACFRDAVVTLARARVGHGQSRAQVARAVGIYAEKSFAGRRDAAAV